jgi:hypothetical protein
MDKFNKIDKSDALFSLCSTAEWVLRGEELEWLDTTQTQPTDAEITAEITRLQTEYDSNQYSRDRQPEYPPVTDYLDGIVKGDTAQVDKYIADCLAVKAKYPKP